MNRTIALLRSLPENSKQIVQVDFVFGVKDFYFMWFLDEDRIDLMPMDGGALFTLHRRDWNHLKLKTFTMCNLNDAMRDQNIEFNRASLEELQSKLTDLVKDQKYEEACEIRDMINEHPDNIQKHQSSSDASDSML